MALHNCIHANLIEIKQDHILISSEHNNSHSLQFKFSADSSAIFFYKTLKCLKLKNSNSICRDFKNRRSSEAESWTNQLHFTGNWEWMQIPRGHDQWNKSKCCQLSMASCMRKASPYETVGSSDHYKLKWF